MTAQKRPKMTPEQQLEAFKLAAKAIATGIAYAITAGAANSDTTAVAANQVVGSIQYG